MCCFIYSSYCCYFTMISPNNVQKTQLKIGLFTDTYRPTVNGISVVVDTLKRQMEAAGHQPVVVCPTTRAARNVLRQESHVITVPSVKGWPYDEYDVSFFWPPSFRKRLLAEKFDVIIFFTPGQLGLMAMDIMRTYLSSPSTLLISKSMYLNIWADLRLPWRCYWACLYLRVSKL